MTKRSGKKHTVRTIGKVRKVLCLPNVLGLKKEQITKVVGDCRQSMLERKNGDGRLIPLVAGRVATAAVIDALQAVPTLRVSRVGTTDIIVVDGVRMRIHAVCNKGVYVLAETKNAVPVDAVIAVRVRFLDSENDLRKVKLSFLGCRRWDEVAVSECFHAAGSRIVLPSTDDYPRGGGFSIAKDCYAVMAEEFAA